MKDKYLSFSRVIGQDVKELIKYFEPREIAREEEKTHEILICRSKTLTRSKFKTGTFQFFSTS